MSDESPALEVEVLAMALRDAHRDAGSRVEFLARQLEEALPDRTTVARGGFFLAARRPVKELTVKFGERHLKLRREADGPIVAEDVKVVRGIAIGRDELALDDWVATLLAELKALADAHDGARAALRKFQGGSR